MVEAMVDYCKFSGCNLIELLYALNEAQPDEKRYQTTDSIIEMVNDELDKLAENEDVDLDVVIEKQFVDLVVKKLEKVAAVHKPDSFIKEILPSLNMEQAVEEVEARTEGKINLLKARVEDRLYTNQKIYKTFADKLKS